MESNTIPGEVLCVGKGGYLTVLALIDCAWRAVNGREISSGARRRQEEVRSPRPESSEHAGTRPLQLERFHWPTINIRTFELTM